MPSLQLPPAFDALQLPLLLLTNILALTVGPQHRVLQLGLSIPVWIVLAAQSLYRNYDGSWGIHYALNCAVLSLLATYVDIVLLESPDREGWTKLKSRVSIREYKEASGGSVKSSKTAGSDGFPEDDGSIVMSNGVSKSIAGKLEAKNTAPTGFWDRLWWAIRLACTYRYTGWSCEVKNVPIEVEDSYPRWRFLIRKFLRAVLFYFAKDAMYAYTASSPHGSWVDIVSIKPAHTYSTYPFWHRFWYSWVYIVLTYVSLELYNTVVGIVSVAFGLAKPSECPSAFGDLKGLWSVRRAWSNVWHQQCRRVCSKPGIFVARDVLHLRKGSFASKYLQLFIGFGVSGIVHGGASMLCHGSLNDDGAIKVFVGQAIIIFVEDHLIKLGNRVGFVDSTPWRLVGFFWTVLAIGASMESWTGLLLEHGLWVHDRELDWFGIGPKV